MPTTYKDIYSYLETLPVVSSHEHHWPDELQLGLTLERVLDQSYVGWRGAQVIGATPEERAALLARHRGGSYFTWLEKGIQRVHGFSEKITAENWDALSERVAARHATPGEHVNILAEAGRYRRAVQDTYWQYGSDIGHPEMFSPAMRTDMFIRGFHPDVRDHDGNSPFSFYPETPRTDFAAYLDWLLALFTGWRNAGAVALKSASAYERSLGYGPGDLAAAAKVFGRRPETVGAEERSLFEETLFNWFCALAAKLDAPFQVHMGLGQLTGSRPMLFAPTLERHPRTRFVLFHMGYPWYSEVGALAHNYRNALPDMVWAPIISPTAAISALHQYIEVTRTNDLIAWGSDTWTSEDAVGALLAWQHVVATVLSEKVESGYIDMADAERLARGLMYENAAKIYGFDL